MTIGWISQTIWYVSTFGQKLLIRWINLCTSQQMGKLKSTCSSSIFVFVRSMKSSSTGPDPPSQSPQRAIGNQCNIVLTLKSWTHKRYHMISINWTISPGIWTFMIELVPQIFPSLFPLPLHSLFSIFNTPIQILWRDKFTWRRRQNYLVCLFSNTRIFQSWCPTEDRTLYLLLIWWKVQQAQINVLMHSHYCLFLCF